MFREKPKLDLPPGGGGVGDVGGNRAAPSKYPHPPCSQPPRPRPRRRKLLSCATVAVRGEAPLPRRGKVTFFYFFIVSYGVGGRRIRAMRGKEEDIKFWRNPCLLACRSRRRSRPPSLPRSPPIFVKCLLGLRKKRRGRERG